MLVISSGVWRATICLQFSSALCAAVFPDFETKIKAAHYVNKLWKYGIVHQSIKSDACVVCEGCLEGTDSFLNCRATTKVRGGFDGYASWDSRACLWLTRVLFSHRDSEVLNTAILTGKVVSASGQGGGQFKRMVRWWTCQRLWNAGSWMKTSYQGTVGFTSRCLGIWAFPSRSVTSVALSIPGSQGQNLDAGADEGADGDADGDDGDAEGE